MADTLVCSPLGAHQVVRIFDNRQLIERFDKWLMVVGFSMNTRSSYIFTVKAFAKFMVGKPVTAATKDDVRVFLGDLFDRGLAAVTIQGRLYALRSFFKFLQLGGCVRDSVPRYIKNRKLPKRLPGSKSEAEINSIIEAARTVRDRAILELLYASGIRVSECAHLRVEDVNLRARSLVVRRGKGDKDRLGLFGRKAAKALTLHLGDRRSGPLFVEERPQQRGYVYRNESGAWWGHWRGVGDDRMRNVRLGDYDMPTKERAQQALDAYLAGKLPKPARGSKGLTARSIHRIVVRAAKRAGVTGVHPHTMRHSCATHLLNRGVDVRFVQELLGHTTLVTTSKYLHVAIDRLQKVHELLGR